MGTVDINTELIEYFNLDSQMKRVKGEIEDKKKILKEYLYEHGIPDAKGSIKMSLDEGKIEDIVRESVKINDERAVSILQRKGFLECLKEVTVYEIIESNVEKRASEGDLNTEDLSAMMDTKTTKAFYVKKR